MWRQSEKPSRRFLGWPWSLESLVSLTSPHSLWATQPVSRSVHCYFSNLLFYYFFYYYTTVVVLYFIFIMFHHTFPSYSVLTKTLGTASTCCKANFYLRSELHGFPIQSKKAMRSGGKNTTGYQW